MKKRSQQNWSPFNGRNVDYRILTSSFVGSVLVHAILIGMLFVGFDHTPRIATMPSAINVTMISTADLPKAGPPPAKKAKPDESLPQLAEEPEAPLVTAEDLAAMEPEASAPADNGSEPVPEEPPVKEPETAAPVEPLEEAAPKEPVLKKPALKKPADLPKPIPPQSKEQVIIKDAPKKENPPPVKEKPEQKPKPTEEIPKEREQKPKEAEQKPAQTAQKPKKTEAQPKAAEREPKVIKPNTTNQKSAGSQKSVVTPSAARAESIKDAIDKVKARAKKSSGGSQSGGSSLAANRTGGGGGSGQGGGAVTGAGQAGGVNGSISDIYKAQISYQIERNWAFSANLAGGRKDLRTILVITILPTGQIQNLWYEQRSGNNFLDQSAYNAVMKSNPLPPLPKGYPEYTIALVFTPAGLN